MHTVGREDHEGVVPQPTLHKLCGHVANKHVQHVDHGGVDLAALVCAVEARIHIWGLLRALGLVIGHEIEPEMIIA